MRPTANPPPHYRPTNFPEHPRGGSATAALGAMVGRVGSDQIEISFTVDREEAADMTLGQRERWLGKLAEEQLGRQIPPRPSKSGARTDRWMPYTRESIAAAFQEWARLHDGKAPVKADWSHSRDPERRWPRPEGESFHAAIDGMARQDGITLRSTAPCRDKPEERARLYWHEAQHAIEAADGRLEATVGILRSGEEIVERWEPSDVEVGPDPGPYCQECFHGSGCRPADMSRWQYAVEVVGGLTLRNGGDFHATRSRREEFGRNRQMVTGGAADVHPEASDPAAKAIVETIDGG